MLSSFHLFPCDRLNPQLGNTQIHKFSDIKTGSKNINKTLFDEPN